MQHQNGNAVPIDEQAVHDELRELGGDPAVNGVAPAAPGAPLEEPAPPMDWTLPSGALVKIIDKVVAPNWDLEDGEKAMLHEGITQTLSAFFPTVNIDPRVQALLALGGIVVAIAGKRVDLVTRKIVPLRKPKPAPPELPPDADFDRAAA
jgi:hypothetical protein